MAGSKVVLISFRLVLFIRIDRDDTKRNQGKVEQVKIRMGIQIDDVHFRTLLQDTQVGLEFIIRTGYRALPTTLIIAKFYHLGFLPQILNTKDHTKWNWENIAELVQGPLLNPRRLEEAMRGSKFIKRLLAFYRPFSHRFSDIKASKVRLGLKGASLLLTRRGGFI